MADVPGTAANLLKALKSIDPELRKRLVQRVKAIGKPIETSIKSNLPTSAPLSKFNNPYRLGWNVGKPANSTSMRFRSSANKERAVTPLLSIRTNSAAVAVVDMAGRGRGGSTPQGRAMVRNLNERAGRASRYVWPAGLAAQPQAEREIQITIDEASKIVNDRYR